MPKPGVGYVLPYPRFSYAGASHNPKWATPVSINTSISIEGKSGLELDTALAQRYAGGDSNRRRAGAPGVHSSAIAGYLWEAFLSRSAWWAVDYEAYDGVPTITEIYDAYFGQKGDRGLSRYITKREGGTIKIPPPVSPIPLPPVSPISTATPTPVSISILPLSHPSIRVEEIRSALLSNANVLPEPWNRHIKTLLSNASAWNYVIKPITIDALVFLRKWRHNLGIDKRQLP